MKFFTALFLILTVISCNKTQDNSTGVGDVLVVTKKVGTQTVYGVSLYAYTFSSFESVKAVSSVDPTKQYTLKANAGYSTNFYYETPDAELSTTKPAAATYNFSAVFKNGKTDEFSDALSDKVLDLPTITKCEYDSTTHVLNLNWDLLDNAQSYAINILDGTTTVFGSTELGGTIKSYAVKATGNGWATGFTPEAGKTYTVRLLAFLYEPSGDAYNVQAASVSESTVVWGN